MFRRLVAVTLLVSFLAMATSGAMMFVIEKPSFTIQMHPVHKQFGILMVLAASAHLVLNFRSIKNHLKMKSALLLGSALVVGLMLLYGVVLNNHVAPELAQVMDAAAEKAEAQQRQR